MGRLMRVHDLDAAGVRNPQRMIAAVEAARSQMEALPAGMPAELPE